MSLPNDQNYIYRQINQKKYSLKIVLKKNVRKRKY